MGSATGLRGVAGKRAAGPSELVFERDRGGERNEASGEAHAEVVEGCRRRSAQG